MISVTRLDGSPLFQNAEQIVAPGQTPGTLVDRTTRFTREVSSGAAFDAVARRWPR
jgi:hypothetical protein